MTQTKIVLVDMDAEYLSILEQSFIKEYQYSVDLEIITDKVFLLEYFNTPKTISVLLINENMYNDDFSKHNISHTFLLTEVISNTDDNKSSEMKLYKYSGASQIIQQVIRCTGISGKINKNADITKIITVYSPAGGSGQTTIAVGLCATLSLTQLNVLYVNTDGLQNFRYLVSENNRLSGVEKSFISKSQYLYDKIKPLITNNIFDCLPPFDASLASLGLSESHIYQLINMIKQAGDYDFIVIDCARNFTEETARLMADSDFVVLITLQDSLSVKKFLCLTDNIDTSNNLRFLYVCNKYDKKKNDDLLLLNTSPRIIENDNKIDPRNIEHLANVAGIRNLSQLFI